MATESLCWTCKCCRADRCLWVAKGVHVWDKAREGSKYGGMQLYAVQECQHYVGPRTVKMAGTKLTKETAGEILRLVIDKRMPQTEVAKRLGVKNGTVHRYLGKAVEYGEIVRKGQGVYTWAK